MNKKLVFTGGHHTSAMVVALELQKKGWEIVWFGHRHSMWGDQSDSAEYQDVTATGIKFYDLKAGKFYRTYNPLKLIRIPYGFIQALLLLLLQKPNGIVSFGGYLAVPTVICGWLLGIKSITHEQTVTTGWANKLIANFVSKVAVTWPESLKFYRKDKSILVGLPIRTEISSSKINKNSRPTIYITGGKQGAHVINEVIFAALSELTKSYNVIHQTGHSDLEKSKLQKPKNYTSFDFDSRNAVAALHQADIVVSRAGAHTVYELGLLGKKCVLIPIPWVSHHEQQANAEILQKAGLAVILPEVRLTEESLLGAISAARKLTPNPLPLPLDAAAKMVQLVEEQFA